jgi:dTDP-4-amino-4,6-dideoxygalactose transaminase
MAIDAAAVEQLVGERTRAVIDCARFGSGGEVQQLHGAPMLRESGAVQGVGTRLVACCDAGIVMAGGGAVLCTDDLELADAWRRAIGDARLAELAGAVGVAQLEKLPRALGLRSMIAAEYDRMIADIPGVVVLPSASSYVVLVEEGRDVDAVSAALAERGIDARRAIANVDAGLPVAASVAARALAVPFFPAISPQQQERVVRELRDVLAAG